MRAAVYYKNSDVRVEEVPRPEAGEGELLVKVEASGICGSDVMEWYRVKKAPLVLGHEVAGTVEEAGEGVSAFSVGDRVTVAHHVPCNTCRWCLRGEHSVCDTLRTTNFDPGGFAEYLRVPRINVDRGTWKLPDSMSFEEATFAEPLGCVVRGIRKAGLEPGMDVLVLGSGISGLLHIRLARALGAGKIIATDVNDFRLEAASESGADLVLRAGPDVPEKVREFLGKGADLVSVCVAKDQVIETALASLERAATLLMFAPAEPGHTYPVPMFDLWRDNIKVVNTYASPPLDTVMALELIENGRVEVADLITHRVPLGEAQKGFDLVASAGESIKVVMEPHA